MAYQDQYGSNFLGNIANMYPPRPDDEQCKFCSICRATDHWGIDCPSYGQPSYQAENMGHYYTFEPTLGSSQQNSQLGNLWQPQLSSSPQPSADSYYSRTEEMGKEILGILDSLKGDDGNQGRKTPPTNEEKIPEEMGTTVESVKSKKMSIELALEEQAKRIEALEQAKSSDEEIISAQAKRIDTLEATVEKLRTRLEGHQKQQEAMHKANLRRIKQADIEVHNLRTKWEKLNSDLRRHIQMVAVNNINSAPKDDSLDEDEGVMLFRPDSRDENASTSCTNDKEAVCAPGTEVKHGAYNGHLRVVNTNLASSLHTSSESKNIQVEFPDKEIRAACEKFWESLPDQYDDADLKQFIEQFSKVEYLPSVSTILPASDRDSDCQEKIRPSKSSKQEVNLENKEEPCTSKATTSTDTSNQVELPRTFQEMFTPLWEAVQTLEDVDRSSEEIDDFLKDLEFLASPEADVLISEVEHSRTKLKSGVRDTCSTSQPVENSVSVQKFEAETSCGDCGLHCTHQLRACVNMIQVMPSVKKVKAKEIRGMVRTKKRKIHQHWVPRGIFDIKERSMPNIADVASICVKSYMPQWRKRKRRTPSTSDSYD